MKLLNELLYFKIHEIVKGINLGHKAKFKKKY